VQHVYLHDPDLPNQAPPLARPESLVKEGEVIISIDGQSLLSVSDERSLLRGKAGQQVLLHVKSAAGAERDVLVTPIKSRDESTLRYAEWEYTRRQKVDAAAETRSATSISRPWAPTISINGRASFIPSSIARASSSICATTTAATSTHGSSTTCCARPGSTGSRASAIRPGICSTPSAATSSFFAIRKPHPTAKPSRRLQHFQMGKVIGTRTWGGEIWLSGSNTEADNGVATAAEMGVYSPDGKWLIEGHGVDPDIVVDNLPHATFDGSDAQLQAGIDLLKQEIKDDPRPVPQHPPYPDKSFKYQP
jgi:tricorn protease